MKMLATDAISIRDRQRKSMDRKALEELKESILARGLLHAIVVRSDGTLVAGGRRHRAISELHAGQKPFYFNGAVVPLGMIPTVCVTHLGELGYREAELEENIRREDLEWQEKTAAIEELHRIRQAQNPAHTKRDTANEIADRIGRAPTTAFEIVDKATIVAPHLDDPDVNRASSFNEAFKIVSRKMEAEFSRFIKPSQQSEHTLLRGDCKEIMRTLEPKFDCIIGDPPYGIDAGAFGNAAALQHQYDDQAGTALEVAEAILTHGLEVTRSSAHLYLFCDIEHFKYLRGVAADLGWHPMRTPLIWTKGSQGHVPDQSMGFRRTYELILFASKGKKNLLKVTNDRFDIQPEGEKIHAAQKPVALYRALLELSTIPGDQVLDPTCGSGTVFRAASALKLKATGIEYDEQYWTFANAALNGTQPPSSSPVSDLASI